MSNNVLYPTHKEFETMLDDNKIVLVDFWATWCGPCRMVAPVIEQIAEEYVSKIAVAKIDIDENSNLANKYEVQSIPTIVLFENGIEKTRLVGVRSYEDYCEEINKLL